MADLTERTDEDLFEECLRLTEVGGDDEQDRRKVIGELSVRRATRRIFERALRLAASGTSSECVVGIDVLNDFGPKANFPWRDETIGVLVHALGQDDKAVLHAALAAVGKFGPPAALEPVTLLAADDDNRIRLSVAQALPRHLREAAAGDECPGLTALIQLTADADDVIRNWATFGLGSQTDLDGSEVRAALLARLEDTDANTRHEALVGLARRHDRRVIPALVGALDAEEVAYLAIEAAELLGAPEASESLRRLAECDSWTAEELEAAIRRCDSGAQDRLVAQLAAFMSLIDARHTGFTCFSDRIPVDSGGPQICFADDGRYFTWSFEELLARAARDVATAVELVIEDIS